MTEHTSRQGDSVKLDRGVKSGQHVVRKGSEQEAVRAVLAAGTRLGFAELAAAAQVGAAHPVVTRKPRVAVLSTGDEVAEPGTERKAGQIYDSNRFSLCGLVEAAGASAIDLGIVPDQLDELSARLAEAAATADVVLTSGGVSVGDHDLVKSVLGDSGEIEFWQVAMQPGRPLAMGHIGRALFFGLPGNPVASMLTFHLFVRPALWKLCGRRELFPPRLQAVAAEPMRKRTGRREFKRGILSPAAAGWEVRTTGPQGSGILTSMVQADCFVVLEEERGDVAPGERVWVELFSLA